jgi:hypothetical protein
MEGIQLDLRLEFSVYSVPSVDARPANPLKAVVQAAPVMWLDDPCLYFHESRRNLALFNETAD